MKLQYFEVAIVMHTKLFQSYFYTNSKSNNSCIGLATDNGVAKVNECVAYEAITRENARKCNLFTTCCSAVRCYNLQLGELFDNEQRIVLQSKRHGP